MSMALACGPPFLNSSLTKKKDAHVIIMQLFIMKCIILNCSEHILQ